MSLENKLLIIKPIGVQGPTLGLSITETSPIKEFDEEVGKLPADQRQNVSRIKEIAINLSIEIVKP